MSPPTILEAKPEPGWAWGLPTRLAGGQQAKLPFPPTPNIPTKAPTQPPSFSDPLLREFKFLAGGWMGTLLLGWQNGTAEGILPSLGFARGHGELRGKLGFPGRWLPPRFLSCYLFISLSLPSPPQLEFGFIQQG